MAAVGSGLGFSPHPRYCVKLDGRLVGTSVGGGWLLHVHFITAMSALPVPGRVSLFCAWKKPRALGVACRAQLLEGLSASQWVREGLARGKAIIPYPHEDRTGRIHSDTPAHSVGFGAALWAEGP